jgi:hypothetical protein
MKSVTSDRIYLWSKRIGAILLIAMAIVAAGNAQRFSAGEDGKAKGQMVSRKGDQVKVQDTKTGSLAVVVNIPMRWIVAPVGYGTTRPECGLGKLPGSTWTGRALSSPGECCAPRPGQGPLPDQKKQG